MRVVAIVQQRMGSTRLPGKAMLPLAGEPLTKRLLERVKRATSVEAVCLAVPATRENFVLQDLARSMGVFVSTWTGEDDLVYRHLKAAIELKAEIVVRIPGDNPCVDPAKIDTAVTAYLRTPCLYYSNTVQDWDGHFYVDGLGCEVMSRSRLRWLQGRLPEGPSPEREHPHRFFEQHLAVAHRDFWRRYAKRKHRVPTVRLDVNTPADYGFVKDIYESLYPINPNFGAREILAYLDREECHDTDHKTEASRGREREFATEELGRQCRSSASQERDE